MKQHYKLVLYTMQNGFENTHPFILYECAINSYKFMMALFNIIFKKELRISSLVIFKRFLSFLNTIY